MCIRDSHWGALDAFFILSLILAEVYAFFVLFLGYFQTVWPLRRAPVALPEEMCIRDRLYLLSYELVQGRCFQTITGRVLPPARGLWGLCAGSPPAGSWPEPRNACARLPGRYQDRNFSG